MTIQFSYIMQWSVKAADIDSMVSGLIWAPPPGIAQNQLFDKILSFIISICLFLHNLSLHATTMKGE